MVEATTLRVRKGSKGRHVAFEGGVGRVPSASAGAGGKRRSGEIGRDGMGAYPATIRPRTSKATSCRGADKSAFAATGALVLRGAKVAASTALSATKSRCPPSVTRRVLSSSHSFLTGPPPLRSARP